MKRHKITTERALLIAQEAKGLFADENERQIRTRSITTTLTPIAITKQSKARSASAADTLLFIVNYSNNNGFVFVSNDDRDGEILMYAGGGNFAMQDTTGNPGLKLHVEMMIAYQEHKLNEIKAAEARGEEYTGSMTTETLNDAFAPNDVMPAGIAAASAPSGMPGMPGHTCNITGMPGSAARKDIWAPATYVEKEWFGDDDAVELAQNKYKNQKCFGVPTSPPNIGFMTTGGEHGHLGTPGEAPRCESAPYCAPPLWNYKEYYNFYGCWMNMLYKQILNIEDLAVPPLLTTCWDQQAPLKHGSYAAGCGPIAMAQIMVYHTHPNHRYNIPMLRALKTNTDIAASPYKQDAMDFLEELRDQLDVTYSDGATSVSTLWGTNKIRNTFETFGYSVHDGGFDYHNDYNFDRVISNLKAKQPVFIFGHEKGELTNGHMWVLDGYRTITNRYYYADYYFDEYGKFNAENRYIVNNSTEYVHANMGWGPDKIYIGDGKLTDIWVRRRVYEFAGKNYDGRLRIVVDIIPNK